MTDTLIETDYWWVGALFFLFSLFIHGIYWRKARATRSFTLLFTFFLLPPFLLACVSFFREAFIFPSLINFILAVNYIAIFPAIQASSPSIKILALLFKNNGRLEKDILISHFPKDSLLLERYKDLETAGLIRAKNDGGWILTKPAQTLAQLFFIFRYVLGLKEGEG